MDYPDVTMAWSLTRGMARTLGINLVEAVTDGWYTREELARLVDTCSHCGLAEQCQSWLAVTPKAAALPFYCPIKSDLEALAP